MKIRVEVELDKELVELAIHAGINLNEVADRALQRALGPAADPVRKRSSGEAARRWEQENAEAIRESNAELKRNGLWSDRYRLF
jgi:post-segregation antitoxin (ccd killing protein)